jgi:osmotically inducible lipoprotein OsmB
MQRSIGIFLACSVLLGGCASWSDAQKGTAIGPGAGALIGNAVGGGVLGTVGGAAVGGVVGHEIGRNQDQKKEQK